MVAGKDAYMEQEWLSKVDPALRHNAPNSYLAFVLYLTVWGVEPVVTHQTSWLESTGGSLDQTSAHGSEQVTCQSFVTACACMPASYSGWTQKCGYLVVCSIDVIPGLTQVGQNVQA